MDANRTRQVLVVKCTTYNAGEKGGMESQSTTLVSAVIGQLVGCGTKNREEGGEERVDVLQRRDFSVSQCPSKILSLGFAFPPGQRVTNRGGDMKCLDTTVEQRLSILLAAPLVWL